MPGKKRFLLVGYREIRRARARKLAAGETPPAYPQDVVRPVRRADCVNGPRPCPFVACKYHLFLDVTEHGSIQLNFDTDVAAIARMRHTCALDVADAGEHTHDFISEILGVTRAMVQHAQDVALLKLKRFSPDISDCTQKDLGRGLQPKRQRALQLIKEGLTHKGIYDRIKEEYGAILPKTIIKALFVASGRQRA